MNAPRMSTGLGSMPSGGAGVGPTARPRSTAPRGNRARDQQDSVAFVATGDPASDRPDYKSPAFPGSATATRDNDASTREWPGGSCPERIGAPFLVRRTHARTDRYSDAQTAVRLTVDAAWRQILALWEAERRHRRDREAYRAHRLYGEHRARLAQLQRLARRLDP